MYYRYDNNYVLIEKSVEPLEGDNVVTYWEDIDIDLFKVVVGVISEDGTILKLTKTIKNEELLEKKLKELEATKEEVNTLKGAVDTICQDFLPEILEMLEMLGGE